MDFAELEDEDDESEEQPPTLILVPGRIKGDGGSMEHVPLADMWGGWQMRINVYMCFLVNDLVPDLEGARHLTHVMPGVVECLLYETCPRHGFLTAPQHCKFCERQMSLISLVLAQDELAIIWTPCDGMNYFGRETRGE